MSDPAEYYPLLFRPVLKDYIWGGRNLERILGRAIPDGRIAESWEIAAHEDGTAVVINGIYAGLPLTAVHNLMGINLIGRHNAWAEARGKFPLLVKILDATDKLSVQVHPDDEFALAHEGNELGKTEMWVILHAEPGAALVLGLQPGTTAVELRQAIERGTVEQYLHLMPVSVGDFVCVPSGTLHAILGGVMIAEIQQNSNTTYRVYDWNRTQNGVARPLHIEKALSVINFESPGGSAPKDPTLLDESGGVRRWLLCRNRYFTTERVEFAPGAKFSGYLNGDTLEIWGAIAGSVELDNERVSAVQFALLPAASGAYQVYASTGAICLRTYVEGSA
ncbi:MAG TPA: class I mannose-6-phosphate isomerase [Promineifilum sp.]|nr:class I mannose-6-phosphate isomerase [Promineifilum sp.]